MFITIAESITTGVLSTTLTMNEIESFFFVVADFSFDVAVMTVSPTPHIFIVFLPLTVSALTVAIALLELVHE